MAWGSVPRSIEMPLLYDETNIKGILNMMEAARKNSVKKFSMFQVHRYMEMSLAFLK